MSQVGSAVGDIFGAGGGLALINKAYSDLGTAGDTAYTRSETIADDTAARGAFTGYTVAGPNGGTSVVGADGGLTNTMGEADQRYADQMAANALDYAGTDGGSQWQTDANLMRERSMIDPNLRRQEMYDQIRATQMPDEMRQRLAMEGRMANSGRRGVQSGMFGGGNAESYGMQTAINENMNTSMLNAQSMAQAEQMQQANIANQYATQGSGLTTAGINNSIAAQGASYLPEAQMQSWMQANSPYAAIENQSRLQNAELWGTGRMTGLDAYLASNLGQASMIGNVGSGMLSSATEGEGFLDWLGTQEIRHGATKIQ